MTGNGTTSFLQITLIVGLVAGIVAGYFSVAVGITIFACILFQAVTGMAFKLYFSKKI